MSVLIDDNLSVVKYNGIITNKPAVFNSTVTFKAGGNVLVQALPSAATVTVPVTAGALFTHVPTQNETLVTSSVVSGQRMTLVVTTLGTTSYTLTFGTNFKSQGPLVTGVVTAKVFTFDFISDGVNYNEVTRSIAAM